MFGLSTRRYNNGLFNYDPFRELEEMERRFFSAGPAALAFGTDIAEEEGGYISAERGNENEEKKEGYIRRERSYGSYKRSFDISAIDSDAITGDYNNGVLTLHLPKKVIATPEAKRIELS